MRVRFMHAAVIEQFGPPSVLRFTEAARPHVQPHKVLVKIHAASVNPVDWKIRDGSLAMIYGKRFPKILGNDFAGEVVETGAAARKFKPGDAVAGLTRESVNGAYAEYVAVAEKYIAPKPADISFRDAAAVPVAGLTAYQALYRLGKIQPGKSILINGAAGGVGAFAVQIARYANAHVTAVCSASNHELVTRLGANQVIDYTQHDFTSDIAQYDIILDAVAKRSFAECRPALRSGGIYITTLPGPKEFFQAAYTSVLRKKSKTIIMDADMHNLTHLLHLMEAGYIRSVIDKTYPLRDAAAAHVYGEKEHTRGKSILEVIPA